MLHTQKYSREQIERVTPIHLSVRISGVKKERERGQGIR